MSSFDQAELELFRDNVRRFLENEIQPHYEQWEKEGWMPREYWHKLGENGLLCVDMPEQYGGSGVSFHFSRVVN
ncbi:MAG: acyl-CoA dehydrogenase family protein, partial [Moraxellaceae bacterium]|nr:acyl-CoA dehydrogenase family protein [Moraxellaceae bacterium]